MQVTVENKPLARLKEDLGARVIGQDAAIERLCAAVWRSELAFHDRRPRGSFLFLGSTGVGKTELSLALAESLCGGREHVSRFDMSEYMDASAIHRLVGHVDGYQGQLRAAFERAGERQVFLFDEMEKAHPEILNVFLQILDAARFTTANGEVCDFRQAFVVMTSNVGSAKILNARLLKSQVERSVRTELFSTFRPEFLNRFDDMIVFEHLTPAVIAEILELRIRDTLARFAARGFGVDVGTCVKDFILVEGYNRKLGARPLKRAIVKNLVDPLTAEIVGGRLAPGRYQAKMKLISGVQQCNFTPYEHHGNQN